MMSKQSYDHEMFICAIVECASNLGGRCEPVKDAKRYRTACNKGAGRAKNAP